MIVKISSTTADSGNQSTVLVAWTDYTSLSVPYENNYASINRVGAE